MTGEEATALRVLREGVWREWFWPEPGDASAGEALPIGATSERLADPRVVAFLLGTLSEALVQSGRAVSAYVSNACRELACELAFVVVQNPSSGETLAQMEEAIRETLREFADRGVNEDDLAKFKAQFEAGQIFGMRQNEMILFSQNRPLRTVHRDGGWTAEAIAEHAIPALSAHFYTLERSGDVFSWDPV